MNKLSDLLTMSDLAQVMIDSVEEWKKNEGNPVKIRKDVFEKLSSASEKIILKAIGIEKKYGGGYETTDGSHVSEYIATMVRASVEAWCKEQLGETPQLSEEEKSSMRSLFKSEYLDALKEGVKSAASRKAQEDASELRDIFGTNIDELQNNAKALMDGAEREIEKKPKIEFRVFKSSGTLELVEFICPVYITENRLSSVDIASPTREDVWFLVKIKSSISNMSTFIVTDCKEYLPCRVRLVPSENDGVWVHEADSWILSKFTPSHAIFDLMNEIDMKMINKAVNNSV